MEIAVAGGKGGTGKSTVASSLAIVNSMRGETLLVDCDVECPNDHLLISAELEEKEKVYQLTPNWDIDKCTQCGRCAEACNQDAIVFVKGKSPAFVQDKCIGCGSCIFACPEGAISKSRRPIGTISEGSAYGVDLVSGQLDLGEFASGEVVAEVRQYAAKKKHNTKFIDASAGIGCPVIASLVGTDYIIAVTEPTPSALHDLKRVLYLAKHFGIGHGIVINKSSLHEGFRKEILHYAEAENIGILGEVPYSKDFVECNVEMKPVVFEKEYCDVFDKILETVLNRT
jgi:MinD superfamily P-loop ATPase